MAVDAVIVATVIFLLVELQLQLIGFNVSSEVNLLPPFSHPLECDTDTCIRSPLRIMHLSTFFSLFFGLSSCARSTHWDPWLTGASPGTSTPLFEGEAPFSTYHFPVARFDMLLLVFVSVGFVILLSQQNTPVGKMQCSFSFLFLKLLA